MTTFTANDYRQGLAIMLLHAAAIGLPPRTIDVTYMVRCVGAQIALLHPEQ